MLEFSKLTGFTEDSVESGQAGTLELVDKVSTLASVATRGASTFIDVCWR